MDRSRLAAIGRVLAAQAQGTRRAPARTATTDLTEALTGADFVFSAIRVHGLAGRVIDEQVALSEGVLGQETTGAGGISYGLRTVPVATAIARRIALVAPDAWVINFTNPAGLVTEAMAAHLGDRVIGICDSPAALGRRVLRALGLSPDKARLGYAGLNHLGWLTSVRVGDDEHLPRLLADDAALASIEEGRLFGAERLARARRHPERVSALLLRHRQDRTRGAARRRDPRCVPAPAAAGLLRGDRNARTPAGLDGGAAAARRDVHVAGRPR